MKSAAAMHPQRKRWALSWELQAVAHALSHTLDTSAAVSAGLPEQLHRARLQVMQGLGPNDTDSSRVLREMAAGALRRWGLLRTLQSLMSQRKSFTSADSHARPGSTHQHVSITPLRELPSLSDCLIRLALSWMIEQPEKSATVVDQAVDCAKRMVPGQASYTNALLRRFSRERHALLEQAVQHEEAQWNVPLWWLSALRRAYPKAWEQVLAAAALPAPICLRVNRRKTQACELAARIRKQGLMVRGLEDQHMEGETAHQDRRHVPVSGAYPKLFAADALYLPASTDPTRLEGFEEGLFSVQDLGAQQAAWLLDVADGMKVLDACAAPGGKTGHILELADCELHAWDLSAKRLERVAQLLQRLHLRAELACVDLLTAPKLPAPDAFFDRILLDAPCTASGIIGRHPEIRWRRQPEELKLHQSQQLAILQRLWPLLRPGGRLLFVTCSLFPEEGKAVLDQFLEAQADAVQEPLDGFSPLLPICDDSRRYDGFYYGRLLKQGPPSLRSP